MYYLLGIDSTDAPSGGCTTYTMARLLKLLDNYKIQILGYPRLIRLNPNIPIKTRGNAALSVYFSISLQIDELYNIILDFVMKDFLKFNNHNSIKEPGVVLIELKANNFIEAKKEILIIQKKYKEFYTETLTKVVKTIPKIDSKHRITSSIGTIGAFAAVIADLSIDFTYELIAYRKDTSIKRELNIEKLKELENRFTTTFSSIDRDRELICPSGPDPVLCGIRGESTRDLIMYFKELNINNFDFFIIYQTNQATNSHVDHAFSELEQFNVISTFGKITSHPKVIHGGHVIFNIFINDQIIRCVAFEPTKNMAKHAQKLIPGDIIFLHGNFRLFQGVNTIALEYIYVINLIKYEIKIPPVCNNCGKRMTNAGVLAGYKCKICGNKKMYAEKKIRQRELFTGQRIYSSLSAQRHLTRPYKRLFRRNKAILTKMNIKDIISN